MPVKNIKGMVFPLVVILSIVCFIDTAYGAEDDTRIAAKTSTTSLWSFSSFWNWLSGSNESGITGYRTFGTIRRLKNALIPLMFKLGVLSTMIFLLVFLGLKSVFLLKTILILNLGAILAKLLVWKVESQHGPHNIGWPHGGWGPPQSKEVHVHIHNSGGGDHHAGHLNKWTNESPEPYGAYSTHNVHVDAGNQRGPFNYLAKRRRNL